MFIRNFVVAASLVAASVAPAVAAPQPGKAYHVYVPGRKSVAPGAATMLYYAGPVIGTVKVVSVMWSAKVNATIKSKITPFLKAIVNSTYVDQFAQYDTNRKGVNGKQGTNQTITRGTFVGQFVIKPKNKSKNLQDSDVQAEIEAQIAAGNLPANDTNTLYLTYFPSDITITLDGIVSCRDFGAYHFATMNSISPNNIFYGVMPDCGGGINEQTVATSHEFAEAVTDAIPTPGSSPAFPQAWNTSNGAEIGDLCEGNNTTLTSAKKTWVVQEVFTNTTNACATGKFTSP